VRERAELLEPFAAGPAAQLVDNRDADAAAARLPVDGERAHFGDLRAERRELRAPDDPAPLDGDDEASGPYRQLTERARQEVALRQVRLESARAAFSLPMRRLSAA
jgi:hypothetical protein